MRMADQQWPWLSKSQRSQRCQLTTAVNPRKMPPHPKVALSRVAACQLLGANHHATASSPRPLLASLPLLCCPAATAMTC